MEIKSKQTKNIRIFFLPVILISLLTAIDQFTKYIILSSFELYESKSVIDGVFAITYIQNRGMAWGMFQGKIPFFLIFTAIILIFCFRILYNVADNKKFILAKYVDIFLISGAIGNLIDRVTLGYVVDFFNFELIDFPVFNVADIYVVVSMLSAIVLLVFVYSNEEVDEILRIITKTKASKNQSQEIDDLDVSEEINDSEIVKVINKIDDEEDEE